MTGIRRHWIVWFLLVLGTVSSSLLASVKSHDSRTVVVAIAVVAAVKAELVVWDFMELGRCNRGVQLVSAAWPVVMAAVILGLYLGEVV